MSNKYLVITFVLVFSVIAITMFYTKIKTEEDIKLSYIKECIGGRICLEINEEYLIGNNEKELKNNFYDIKISNTENGVNFVVNKLWYKQVHENLYEQDYVKNIIKYMYNIILKKTNNTLSAEEVNVIYNDMLDGYIKTKNGNKVNTQYVIKGIKFNFYSKDYELNLKLEVI